MTLNLKPYFSKFLSGHDGKHHFAAHSHHFWPDVTLDAQKKSWLDASHSSDQKWSKVFEEVIPDVQRHIANTLNLPNPNSLAFAQNTHEFVLRLFSCFSTDKPIRVLTTDSEFHSFSRQLSRWEEEDIVIVKKIEAEPFESFTERFSSEAGNGDYDIIFLSQVFFNSGLIVQEIDKIVRSVPRKETFMIIDGYHGFMAAPIDLEAIFDRAFYMAGGYKYAMAGEGCCFMHCPDGYGGRPVNTGWFAGFNSLEKKSDKCVEYAQGGQRFMGATFDPSGLYRMRAVFHWLYEQGISVADIHEHVASLQEVFLNGIGNTFLKGCSVLVTENRGNFVTFKTEEAETFHRNLLDHKIITDFRGDRLRFGFGLYHGKEDVDLLLKKMTQV